MGQSETNAEEYSYTGRVLVSETDLDGNITYANRKFCEVSGYTLDELVGKPHDIIHHSDMPQDVLQKMYDTIKSGQIWHGLVKNLRKDKRYYWTETEIAPIKDDSGSITGYIGARRPAGRKDVEETESIYKTMLEEEK